MLPAARPQGLLNSFDDAWFGGRSLLKLTFDVPEVEEITWIWTQRSEKRNHRKTTDREHLTWLGVTIDRIKPGLFGGRVIWLGGCRSLYHSVCWQRSRLAFISFHCLALTYWFLHAVKTSPYTTLLSFQFSTNSDHHLSTCKLHCSHPTIGTCHHSSNHIIMAHRICIAQNQWPDVGLLIRAVKRHADAFLGLVCTLINIVPPQRKRILSDPQAEFVSCCHLHHTLRL